MMQSFFYRWIGLGLVVCVIGGCSEKVETEENKAVVEEEVDPFEEIIAGKLQIAFIPRVDFKDVSLAEAIDFLRIRYIEAHYHEQDYNIRRLSFVIRRPKEVSDSKKTDESSKDLLLKEAPPSDIPELRVRNVSCAAALRYICLMTDMRCEVDGCLTITPRDPNAPWNSFGKVIEEKGDSSVISAKLSQIILPRIDFENRSIHEAIDFLRLKSAEMETERKINFVVYVPKGMETPYIDKLQMSDSSFENVLKEICAKTGMRYELDPYSVILVPKDLK